MSILSQGLRRLIGIDDPWDEFASIAGEMVTEEDAIRCGLGSAWFQRLLSEGFGGASRTEVHHLRGRLADPDVLDLVRYVAERVALRDSLGDVAELRFSPYDAIAAGLADVDLLFVVRDVLPGEEEVRAIDLVPHCRRPAVRRLFGGLTGAGAPARLARIRTTLASRHEREAAAGDRIDLPIDVKDAAMSGAADEGTRAALARWFPREEEITLRLLCRVPQEPSLAKLADWRLMMASV